MKERSRDREGETEFSFVYFVCPAEILQSPFVWTYDLVPTSQKESYPQKQDLPQ